MWLPAAVLLSPAGCSAAGNPFISALGAVPAEQAGGGLQGAAAAGALTASS
jgi:hypothetical protein